MASNLVAQNRFLSILCNDYSLANSAYSMTGESIKLQDMLKEVNGVGVTPKKPCRLSGQAIVSQLPPCVTDSPRIYLCAYCGVYLDRKPSEAPSSSHVVPRNNQPEKHFCMVGLKFSGEAARRG